MTQAVTSAGRTLSTVRELILRGELSPGARLGETELADRHGCRLATLDREIQHPAVELIKPVEDG